MATLTIGAVAVKGPTSLQARIVDEYRRDITNAKGLIIRDRIRTRRYLDISWGLMTQTEMSALLTAIDPVFFNVTYVDPKLSTTTKSFTIDKKDITKSLIVRSEVMWEGLDITLKER